MTDEFISGMQVEAPVTEEVKPDPTQQKIDALATTVENMARSQQSEAALLREFLAVKDKPVTTEEPKATYIPVDWDASADPNDPKGVIDAKYVDEIVSQRAQKLFEEKIKPYESVLHQSKERQEITNAVGILEKSMPDVMAAAQDKEWLAARALELYNSQYNPGKDDNERAVWTEQQLRRIAETTQAQQALPTSTGSQTMPAYNAVGRSMSSPAGMNNKVVEFAAMLGVDPSSIPAPGSKITLPAKSIDEVGGLEEYKQYNRRRYAMMDYNNKHNLWTITD